MGKNRGLAAAGTEADNFRSEGEAVWTAEVPGTALLSAAAVAAAAKSRQSCPALCDPRDGTPPGSSVLQPNLAKPDTNTAPR